MDTMPKRTLALILAVTATTVGLFAQTSATPPLVRFLEAASTDDRVGRAAQDELKRAWKNSYAAIIVDLVRFMRPASPVVVDEPVATFGFGDPDGGRPRPSLVDSLRDPGSPVRRRLVSFLEEQTGQRFGDDLNAWRRWFWALPYEPHPDYAEFKGWLYGRVDPRMQAFFPPRAPSTIRLDEIDWGGVTVNGIPPLRYPTVLPVRDAGYLKDSNVVFGIVVNGEARAYPKRILAWHEMAIDRVGGLELSIVYCTLCGTVIPYESVANGRHYKLGTSGLLYQSNKLMFDEDSNSLWSTFEGVPVVGALVGSGVTLARRPVVTTTWGEWSKLHPNTSVLSLDTGHRRDYSEGAAYRSYFASDDLMFDVSRKDARLKNKAEVLVMQLPSADGPANTIPVAIDARLLKSRPVYSFSAGGAQYVVVTSRQGANRAFRAPVAFPDQQSGPTVRDASGRSWQVTEEALILATDPSMRAPRVNAGRAFWFGWFAQFPKTMLLK
jgi:hypothetical protein